VVCSRMDSVEEFSSKLFSESAGLPNSIRLDFDVEEPSELFELLLLVMTHGIKKWYGDRVNIASISSEDLGKLKDYFLSFGYVIHIDSVEAPGVYMIDNKAYLEKTMLDEMKFSVTANKSIYTVWFSFVK
jgi:hypothetical protein